MKYRSRIDIVAQMLEAANNGGATKSKIMYKAFLSYGQLKDYLTIMNEKGLLDYDKKEQLYRTTEKGRKLLKLCNKIEHFTHEQEVAELPRM
ncbi:hypothetical protein Ngar_c25980 [Candidatus Nitrososphaera gargensis Ga9.2]|uniref:ArnR1-like winged helix-turn-helix domain-containing protein n=1 Tax=Nitrososphaera gargensis (strain Ga9.2) TaxID=1237085 RepID=K0IHV5_NITGG|nr:hypothetical protein Ngar_c25980 [Candidatus Nitrososphaera gargensis Ga9.2]